MLVLQYLEVFHQRDPYVTQETAVRLLKCIPQCRSLKRILLTCVSANGHELDLALAACVQVDSALNHITFRYSTYLWRKKDKKFPSVIEAVKLNCSTQIIDIEGSRDIYILNRNLVMLRRLNEASRCYITSQPGDKAAVCAVLGINSFNLSTIFFLVRENPFICSMSPRQRAEGADDNAKKAQRRRRKEIRRKRVTALRWRCRGVLYCIYRALWFM